MKYFYTLLCLLAISNQTIFADQFLKESYEANAHTNCCRNHHHSHRCQLGISGFSTMDSADWYVINTEPYPSTVPLSLNRNRGSTQGDVELTPTGLRINKPGNYFVTFTSFLLNNNEAYMPLVPIFLIRGDVFNPFDNTNLGSVGSLPTGSVTTVQGSGILEYVTAGTTLSIVATNGGSPQPEPITIIGWGITAFRIPCDPQKLQPIESESSGAL